MQRAVKCKKMEHDSIGNRRFVRTTLDNSDTSDRFCQVIIVTDDSEFDFNSQYVLTIEKTAS